MNKQTNKKYINKDDQNNINNINNVNNIKEQNMKPNPQTQSFKKSASIYLKTKTTAKISASASIGIAAIMLSYGLNLNTSYAQVQSNTIVSMVSMLNVDVVNVNNEQQQLKLNFTQGINRPTVINFRDRVIVELPNINASNANISPMRSSLIKDIKLAEQAGKTRLTILLNQAVDARIDDNGQNVWVLNLNAKPIAAMPATSTNSTNLTNNPLPTAKPTAPVIIANNNPFITAEKQKAPMNLANQIQTIDFQKNNQGGGKIIIGLNRDDVPVDIRSVGSSLAIDFLKTKAPDHLRRNYNVNDFSTPVREMSLNNQNDTARLLVKPQGAWNHTSYQMDKRLVVEINPIKQKKQAGADFTQELKKYNGKLISLNFQDIEVRALMQVFADFTGLNIAVNDNVQGNLTVRLKEIPWDQAFDIVMETKALGYKKNGNVIWVAPKEELLAKEKQTLEARAQLADLEPLRTQNIQLNYHKSDIVAKGLLGEGEGKTSPIISKRGSITYDSRTNQLFVTDTADKLEEITTLVRRIDVPVRQVIVEARIVEADDKFGKSLGVKLGGWGTRMRAEDGTLRGGNNALAARFSGSQDGAVASSGFGSDDLTLTNQNSNFVSLPAASILGAQAASMGVTLFSRSIGALLNLELSALEGDGKGKIVSSPRVVTTDKQKAVIEQGTEIPYQAATSSGATSVQFKKANLKLEVTPQITPEGKVFLDVDINKDTPSVIVNGSAGLAIDTKHVQTQVLVEDGGTVMIGGIFQEEERNTTSKVPVLGDIPYLGRLFKSTSTNKNRTELIIFLTPKVIEDGFSQNQK